MARASEREGERDGGTERISYAYRILNNFCQVQSEKRQHIEHIIYIYMESQKGSRE